MEERNLDLDLPLRREQWEEIGQRAAALQREGGDFEWSSDRERIVAYLTNEEASGPLRDLTSDSDVYGSSRLQIAEFVFTTGVPTPS